MDVSEYIILEFNYILIFSVPSFSQQQKDSVIHPKCLFFLLHHICLIINSQINRYNIMMMRASFGPKSKAFFQKGIPLSEYLRNRSKHIQDLQYKDDDTIFYDQQRNPIFIDNFQFVILTKKITPLNVPIPKVLTSSHLIQKNTQRLPHINLNKPAANGECNATERNSTDTSNNEVEQSINFLPTLKKSKIVRERNITMASRSSSRSISCRKRIPKEISESQEYLKMEQITPIKKQTNKEYINFLVKKREIVCKNKLQNSVRKGERYSEMDVK